MSVDKQKSWICPACTILKPKPKVNDHTPIRNTSATRANKRPALASPPQPCSTLSIEREHIGRTIEEAISKHMNDLFLKINKTISETINRQLKPIKEEMSEMAASMSFLNQRCEDIVREFEESKRNIKNLIADSSKMKTSFDDFGTRLSQLEQHARSCNLELQCVPENKKENLYQIVTKLGNVVGCDIQEKDILNCTRTFKQDQKSARPRSIVVQLGSPRIRDRILASTTNYNKTNPANKVNSLLLGLAGKTTPIFVTEHLSPANKSLHAAARVRAKEKGYKHVWVRKGRIFVRKSDGDEYILVRNMSSLEKIV
ncbi:uncharacterized protein LOC111365118 [Spodoptera litura]|uniref:Uncharacterized protein LOC111365118 n=1 Tax=Spodoptera litura TaxID=69820 RepID=A0A9J7EXM3_SPOLT|nr:uncharacterized protein LOC111365118 [Spodoptera litura]